MHRTLFDVYGPNRRRYDYYANVKDRLEPAGQGRQEFRFTTEDFYSYTCAHDYRHYYGSGIGLRSCVDTYVYLKRCESAMDWAYIERECAEMGIAEYEALRRSLSKKLFAGEALTAPRRTCLIAWRRPARMATAISSSKTAWRATAATDRGTCLGACSRA